MADPIVVEKIDIQIFDTPLSPQECLDFAGEEGAGGLVSFVGTVRNQTKGRAVIRLEFEAYVPMALSEMRKIAEAAAEKWPIRKKAAKRAQMTGISFPPPSSPECPRT